jgi:hypothetical protein
MVTSPYRPWAGIGHRVVTRIPPQFEGGISHISGYFIQQTKSGGCATIIENSSERIFDAMKAEGRWRHANE